MPMPGLDIQNLLQSLQKQMQQEKQSQQRGSRPADEDNENEEGQFGSLKREEVDANVPLEASEDRYRNNRDDGRNAARVERLARQVLEQVLQERNRQNRADGRQNKQTDVNNLLYHNKDNNNNNDDNDYDNQDSESESDEKKEDVNLGSLNDYSKVYVVLNSEAIKNSKNVNMLNDLLSSLLSAPPARSKGAAKQVRYKGFVMDDVRRINRESGESKYMKIEDERPRRPQSYGNHGGGGHGRGRGGGGGSNSRTAIPYMKQHGDIYERDD